MDQDEDIHLSSIYLIIRGVILYSCSGILEKIHRLQIFISNQNNCSIRYELYYVI